jgi:hypothetical protein
LSSAFDCISKQAVIVRLAVQKDDQNRWARQFENVDALRRELSGIGLIGETWLSDLDQNVSHALPWQSPDPVKISNALIRKLKLCRIA